MIYLIFDLVRSSSWLLCLQLRHRCRVWACARLRHKLIKLVSCSSGLRFRRYLPVLFKPGQCWCVKTLRYATQTTYTGCLELNVFSAEAILSELFQNVAHTINDLSRRVQFGKYVRIIYFLTS